MVKLTMTNTKFGSVGQLSNRPMTAYLECNQCWKHSEINANSGSVKCPHCGSSTMARFDMGGGKPSWFDTQRVAQNKGEK